MSSRTWSTLSYDFFQIGGSLKDFIDDIRHYNSFDKSFFLNATVRDFINKLDELSPEQIDMILYILKKSEITLDDITPYINDYRSDAKVDRVKELIEKAYRTNKLPSRYVSVEEYYKEDCKVKDKCKCVPYTNSKFKKECGFKDMPLITDPRAKMDIFISYGYEIKEASREALDYINEFPIFILRKGTTLCHSTHKSRLLAREKRGFKIPKLLWWNKFLPGQEIYNGGWFTYETPYGGPAFGVSLFYKVQEDIPILFIPNYKKHKDDKNYFPDYPWNFLPSGDHTDKDEFSGSHIVQGVKNWKEKGYEMINAKYYADELAKKLVSLGFPGYISCDECEVFITHKSMKRMLNQPPYRIRVELDKGDSYKSTFDEILELMCFKDEYCPLQINSNLKDRGDIIDMEIIDVEKTLKKDLSSFAKQYNIEYGQSNFVSDMHKFEPVADKS
jgi:hypothetical protein